jgi:hypothetical protein
MNFRSPAKRNHLSRLLHNKNLGHLHGVGGDKCFDTQENSVPHNKVKKHTIKFQNTQTRKTIKTKGLGLV